MRHRDDRRGCGVWEEVLCFELIEGISGIGRAVEVNVG